MSTVMIEKNEVLSLIERTIMGCINDPMFGPQCQALQTVYFQIKAIEGVEQNDTTVKANRL